MFQTAIIHTGTFVLSFVCSAVIAKIAYDATQLLNRRRQLQELKELIEETKAIKQEINVRPRNCCVNANDESKMKMNATFLPSYFFSLNIYFIWMPG